MSLCACRFTGPLSSKEHRDFHRAWEDTQHRAPVTASHDEFLALLVRLDELEAVTLACAERLGIEHPKPGPGAQAILARAAQEARQ